MNITETNSRTIAIQEATGDTITIEHDAMTDLVTFTFSDTRRTYTFEIQPTTIASDISRLDGAINV